MHDVRELGMHAAINNELVGNITEVWKWAPWQLSYDTVETHRVYWRAHAAACQSIVDSDLIERIREGRYDVAVTFAGQPCHLAIAHLLAIPAIYFDQEGLSDEVAVAAGLPWSAGFIPSSDSSFTQKMSMSQRFVNSLMWLREYIANSDCDFLARLASPRFTELDSKVTEIFRSDYELKKHFDEFPSVAELKRNVDFWLINGDRSLEFYGRETPANLAFVGGYHIEPIKPLYEPWNTTIAATAEGLVLVTLGRRTSFSSMPPATLTALFESFAQFPKSRFFVLTDDLKMTLPEDVSVPANVNLTRHVPQAELLASGAVKMLITSGGMHSLMEAAIFAVPSLILPVRAPDYQNARKFEQRNLAVVLDKNNVTTETLTQAMRALFFNPKYKFALREYQREYDERPLDGLNTLLYWIEYVGNSHGAKHLKRPVELREMSFFKRTGLDLLFVLLVWPTIVMKLLGWLLRPKKQTQINWEAERKVHEFSETSSSERSANKDTKKKMTATTS